MDSLKSVVKGWEDDDNLRNQVLSYIAGFKTKGINKMLTSLVGSNGITLEQIQAWRKLRNSSMHGDMVMPWSDEEQDARINNLIELTHRLSEAYIKRELEKRA